MTPPEIGQEVRIRWVDSGLDAHGSEGDDIALHVATTYGRVVAFGVCPELRKKLPQGMSAETVTLVMCGGGGPG